MSNKVVVLFLCLAVVPYLGYASDAEKAGSVPAETVDSSSSPDSFFQGTWTGEWEGWSDPSIRQGATLEIGKKLSDGVYRVHYSWNAANYRSGSVPAGTVKTEGTAKDGTFFFSWENKQGKKFEMTLRKQDDNTLKARQERPGETGFRKRPYSETLLKRK